MELAGDVVPVSMLLHPSRWTTLTNLHPARTIAPPSPQRVIKAASARTSLPSPWTKLTEDVSPSISLKLGLAVLRAARTTLRPTAAATTRKTQRLLSHRRLHPPHASLTTRMRNLHFKESHPPRPPSWRKTKLCYSPSRPLADPQATRQRFLLLLVRVSPLFPVRIHPHRLFVLPSTDLILPPGTAFPARQKDPKSQLAVQARGSIGERVAVGTNEDYSHPMHRLPLSLSEPPRSNTKCHGIKLQH